MISKEFSEYVEKIWMDLVDKAGNKNGTVDDGDYIVSHGVKKLKGIKNKDVTTRILVNGGVGKQIKDKILETKAKYLNLIDAEDRASFANELTMGIDDES